MSSKNIKIIDPYVENAMSDELKLTLATSDEVNAVETKFNVSFPAGYKEYVTTLGFGEYCNYIRVEMPSKVLSEYKENKQFLNEYGFGKWAKKFLAKKKLWNLLKLPIRLMVMS